MINKNSLIKTFTLVIIALTFLVSCNNVNKKNNSEEIKKPNIILIYADDLGYGDLGCYGQEKIKTPNIDQLASEGMKFTDFYSGSTVCAPSRSCIITGQHTGHTTVRGNGYGGKRIPLNKEDQSIASLLKNAGYKTGIFGKWGLGEPGSAGVPNKKGFDEWFGYLNQSRAHYYFPEFLWRNNKKVDIEENKDGKQGAYTHDMFMKEALNFIDDNKDNPFFIYLPTTIPHAELIVPEESLNEYKGKFEEVAFEGSKSYPPNEYPRATFAAMVSHLDKSVGDIVSKLKKLGIKENTIIVFTSDNGPERGPKHGHDPAFFNSTGGLRGVKRDLYEGGIRVPLIVSWNEKIKAGTTSKLLGAQWDFMNTFLEMAGASPNNNSDGISFLPTLLGGNQENQHLYLYWEYHESKFGIAVRYKKWKYIKLLYNGTTELYNLETDIAETNNIFGQHPGIERKIEKYIKTARTTSQYWNFETKEKK